MKYDILPATTGLCPCQNIVAWGPIYAPANWVIIVPGKGISSVRREAITDANVNLSRI